MAIIGPSKAALQASGASILRIDRPLRRLPILAFCLPALVVGGGGSWVTEHFALISAYVSMCVALVSENFFLCPI
jgi:hypothetical protein